MRCAERGTRVGTAALATQPLAVEQICTGEFRAEPCTRKAIDGFLEVRLRAVAFAEECARPGFDPQRPVGARGGRGLRQSFERFARDVRPPELDARLDELGERP